MSKLSKTVYHCGLLLQAHQARIASLYLPFISILLENFSSLHLKTPPATPPAITKAEKNNTNIKSSENFSNPVTPIVSRRSTVEPTGSLPASARNRDSNFLSIIAGQGIYFHYMFFLFFNFTEICVLILHFYYYEFLIIMKSNNR